MKKLIMFLAGFMLLVLMFGAMFITGAIYDAGEKYSIVPYFFQINNRSSMRPGAPLRPSEIGDAAVRDMLIKKYVVEYFYAIPDAENIARRTLGTGTIARMSTLAVFNAWKDGEADTIQSLAEDKALRLVTVFDEIYKMDDQSDYWIVEYELKTWLHPNDLGAAPVVTRGRMFLNIQYKPGIRKDMGKRTIGEYLESGDDPAAVFRFRVDDVVVQ